MEDNKAHFEYWSTKKVKILCDVQGWVYDLFLRGNGIPFGIKNYSEVVGMLVGVEYK